MLMVDDISPDGIKIVTNWGAMHVGASVFIPCLNTQVAKEQVVKLFKRKKWQVKTKIAIENGKLGIRIWRTI
ncbi:MAG: hypothetical protein CMJ25_10080 [Phycisphaerae bacterium]|nr:hypothetical protein [Phycisphaerae bacterium]